MAAVNFSEMMDSLTPAEQSAVVEFVQFLKSRGPSSPYLKAAQEFIEQHPELLSRLAQ